MDCQRKSPLRTCLLLALTTCAGSAFGQALGAWTPGTTAQRSVDATLVAAKPSIGAATGGPNWFVSFGHDSSNRVWATISPGPTDSLLGYFTNNPIAAVSWGPNNASVFFSAQPPYHSKNLTVLTWNGSGWAWTDLGGDVNPDQRVAVVSWGVGHMAAFHRGTNNKLYVKQYSGSWPSSWTELGSNLRGDPVATVMGPNKMAVCVAKEGGGPYTSMSCRVYQNGSWGGWITAVDTPFVPLSYQVVSTLPGQFTILTPASDSSMILAKRWDGAQFETYAFGTFIPVNAKLLDALSRGGGGMNVVWRQHGTYVYQSATYETPAPLQHSWSADGATWQSAQVGATPVLGARLVSPSPDRVDVFADGVTCTTFAGAPICMHANAIHVYAIGNPSPLPPPSNSISYVTVAPGSDGPKYGFQSGYLGSASPATTVTGRPYKDIYDWWDFWTGNEGTYFSVCGFTVSPGQGWLTSISRGGTTKLASQAEYFIYDVMSGCASWNWNNGTIGFNGTSQITVIHN